MPTFIFLTRQSKNRTSQHWAFLQWVFYLWLLGLQPSWGQPGPSYFVYPGDEGGLGGGYGACPSILVQPTSQTNCSGKGLRYSVQAAGDDLRYEWAFNDNDGKGWVPLSGDLYTGYNTDTLTTRGNEKDGRQYRVTISNSCGTAYSDPATFTQVTPPSILAQPISQSACSSQGLRYSVQVGGNSLRYDWQYSDNKGDSWVSLSSSASNYPGYNTATLTTPGNEPDGRQYRVIITSGSCSVSSEPATFTQEAPPSITVQPVSRTACTTSGSQFSVQADGTALRYAWQFYDPVGNTWVTLVGFETNTATISLNTPNNDPLQIRVVISNDYCSVPSQTVTLTKIPTANITQQPADQTACSSIGLDYRVQVEQEANLNYNWEFKDTNGKGWASIMADTSLYSGFNSAVLITKGDEPSGRQYRVKVDNGTCSINSDSVTFTKLRAATIIRQPISRTACSGQGLEYVVQAEGDYLTFDWEINDNNGKGWVSLSDSSGAYPSYYTPLLITTENEPNGRQYRLTITNECGRIHSDSVTFTRLMPVIAWQPISQTACSDRNNGLQYSVQADGSGGPLTYVWEFNDSDGKGWVPLSNFKIDYPGYDTPTLTTNGVETNGRQYRVKITNSCGNTIHSDSATFTLANPNTLPVVTQQPTSQSACTSTQNSLQYTVVVQSTGPVTYDWEFKDPDMTSWLPLSNFKIDYPGYDTPTLTTNGIETNGRQYRVSLNNGCVYSQAATFTLVPKPAITQQPISQSACSASKNGLQYAVQADGSGSPLSYDWEFSDDNGRNWASLSAYRGSYPGYDTPTLTTNGDEQNGRQYRVIITNGVCSVPSEPATFTLPPLPTITSQPPSASTVIAGATVTASVSVSGPVNTYQWYKDGLPLADQTGANLLLTNVGVGQTGTYRLVVVSNCNSVTSTAFSLIVTAYPVRYVRQGGTGDGTSWASASGDLQAMINAADVKQVWVAQGTYKPTTSTDRSVSFAMQEGVAIYGGFPPSGNPTLAERNPASYTTTLSGDIGVAGDAADNTYNIFVNPPKLTASAILEGFLITGGNANDGTSALHNRGGGMYSNDGSPSLINCIFQNNYADRGGAIYLEALSVVNSPRLINCVFQNNYADRGGAIFNTIATYELGDKVSNPILINCLFENNSAFAGGAFYNEPVSGSTANPSFINCTFLGNKVTAGGGAYCSTADGPITDQPRFVNCVLFNNGGSNTFFDANSGMKVQYCLLETGTINFSDQGNNRFSSVSPFVSETDARLNGCSLAINAGSTADYTQAGGPAIDLGGNPRFYQDGAIDLGAYEYQGMANQPVAITAQPVSATSVLAGSAVTASVSVSGTVSAYQWYKDGQALSGQSSPTLSLTNVQTTDAGQYVVVILSPCQSLTSTAFTLSVIPLIKLSTVMNILPTVLRGPSSLSVVVDVVDLGGQATNGTITLKITRDAKLVLSLSPDAVIVGGQSVQNSVWQLSQESGYYVLTTTASVPAGGRLSVGLTGRLEPAGTKGELSIGGDIFYSSPDQQTASSLDGETIDYFPDL